MIITYNDGFGKVYAVEHDGKIAIKHDAYVRAWQKVSNPKAGFGGGSAEVVFDTDKKVFDTYTGKELKSRA